MSSILEHIVACLVFYFIGVATAKNITRWLLKLRANPRATVQAEIDNLQKLKAGL